MLQRWVAAVRRNHGLEHATVAVLLARHGPRRLAGRAGADGFFVIGDVDEAEIQDCAREALARLQGGEASLAVSPLCGTNIAVTGFLAAAAATAVIGGGNARERFPNAVTAAMIGVVLAQPIGRLVQKHLTTRADLGDIELLGTRKLAGPLKKVYTRERA